MVQPWGFYGRRRELSHLRDILGRNRWFFIKISGRRRIGKTSLVQEALKAVGRKKTLYLQIPDSDAAGVISAARDFLETFQISAPPPHDLRSLASLLGGLARDGYVVAVGEFQYFHRAALYEFTSHLQYEVDRLTREAASVQGGLIVLGSIHTEMSALLEDRAAPLFNRITDQIELPHLDIAAIIELLRVHADTRPERLLFLWNLFEGVPKFYRDCYEQGVLARDRQELLLRMFLSSSSPLRSEADNWFLRELRGRYDLVLKFVARNPGCTNGQIEAWMAGSVDPGSQKQVGGYIKILREKYAMIDRLQPIFSKPTARNGRFYLCDNFLRSWLSALAVPAASVNFRPVEALVREADQRLAEAEGHGLERLVWTLYEERSRNAVGDFALTQSIRGYWDRGDTEIDLVALNETEKVMRLGSCKRNADRLIQDLPRFDGHVARFLDALPRFRHWKVEKVAVAPELQNDHRAAIQEAGYIAQDLADLTSEL